ncbi:MAG: NIPSNAP family protein [Tannerellaceae bacterium]|jgi:hypothetical protein|nr:NIPSNAP family protein [Tannerellaceae bacterium]
MQRRKFMQTAGILASVPLLNKAAASASPHAPAAKAKEIYEWRIYTLESENHTLDDFYKEILIPAYNRKGVQVGAFAPYKKEEAVKRYYLFIYPDLATFQNVKRELWNDDAFMQAARPFYDETAETPAYSLFDTYLAEAFDKIPHWRKPDKSRTLFEFRHYKSPNEEANRRKVKMFNVDEIDIFDKTGINSVCYGDLLAGPRMPSLIYLTWYKDEPTRNEAWKKFVDHPDWNRIKALPEYAHTATDNKSHLLSPRPYSQI